MIDFERYNFRRTKILFLQHQSRGSHSRLWYLQAILLALVFIFSPACNKGSVIIPDRNLDEVIRKALKKIQKIKFIQKNSRIF